MVRSLTRTLMIRGLLVLVLADVCNASLAESELNRLHPVDGGPDYYQKFSRSLPPDANYFPLGVWLESVLTQADVDIDKDAGLNLYVGLTPNSSLPLIERNGMRTVLQQADWISNETAINSPAVAGWVLFDEVDMQQGPVEGYATLNQILARLPNDRRMRLNNYGKGVMFWESNEEAQRFVDDFQHVVSDDIYWFTGPNEWGRWEGGALLNGGQPLTQNQTRRASNYGYTVDRMRALARDGKPIWNVVEVGWPFTQTAAQGARGIRPAEVRAAVWQSIIAGARGIVYFNHSFGGPHQSQHCLREPAYAEVRSVVKSTNQLITQLAPVLNAPFADRYVKADPAVRTMTKFYVNNYYIFAGSKENTAVTEAFSLSDGRDGRATVIGENRSIQISNGRFSDSFEDGNAIHIYRIDNQ
jgi:hypothetical protein